MPIFGISPKTNLFFQIICFSIFSFLFRRIFYTLFSSQITKPTVLVGKTLYLEKLQTLIKNNPQIGLRIIYSAENLRQALEKYADIKNLVFIIESLSVDISNKDIIPLFKNKADILDITKAYERYFFKIPIDYISQSWIIENIGAKRDILYRVISRGFDFIFSICILVLLSPLLVIAFLAIYLNDRGPIFYVQERVGLNGKIFKLLKLRSMVVDSEKNGAVWAEKNDSRVTMVGKIIRKIHLDEIPQMINILRGDMALVGPRPERPEFVKILEEKISNYDLRHIITPGFTGWAQIKYRYANTEEDSKEKFEYDLYYIKNRNIFLDLGIILRTIQIIFTH